MKENLLYIFSLGMTHFGMIDLCNRCFKGASLPISSLSDWLHVAFNRLHAGLYFMQSSTFGISFYNLILKVLLYPSFLKFIFNAVCCYCSNKHPRSSQNIKIYTEIESEHTQMDSCDL